MASSSDEFASYPQSSEKNARTASNLGVGPSSKRRTAASHNNVGKRSSPVEPIQISSDEEEGSRSTVARRGRAATRSAANGRSGSSKGKGKASTGPPSQRSKAGGDGETADETDADVGLLRLGTTVAGDEKERNYERLHARLTREQKKLGDVVKQRDSLSVQLNEMFRLRQEEEKLLVDQKAQYEARLKAQEDTIQELQKTLNRVDTLSRSGGGTSLHFLTRETADEEKQDVQREVSKLKKIIKEKDKIIDERDVHIKELDESIKLLRADLKTEIENTKALTSRNPPSSSKHNSKSAEPKHALVIRLYEELTNILVTNVRHEPGQYKEDDAVYTCVQTSNNKSLNFTLKFFQEQEAVEGGTPSSTQRNGRIVEKVIYTPQFLEQEPREFVTQLAFLASPFTFQKAQMNVFTKTLTSYLEGEIEDNQSDTSQMEVEER